MLNSKTVWRKQSVWLGVDKLNNIEGQKMAFIKVIQLIREE